jgi:hypothetical protein
MDRFTLFVTGLSGEFTIRAIPAGEGEQPKQVVLRKTMELVFKFPGDDVELNRDKVHAVSQKWIWR